MSTFVSVGNATQPFPRLLEAIERLAPELPQPVTVQFGSNSFTSAECRCIDFLSMDSFAEHIGNAELLIVHAGAGTIIHALQAGKVPVVAPRMKRNGEHVDDHQVEFARALAQAGKVIVAEDMVELAAAANRARARQSRHAASSSPSRLLATVGKVLSEYAKSSGR